MPAHISLLSGMTFLLWLLFWGAVLRLVQIKYGRTTVGKALNVIY